MDELQIITTGDTIKEFMEKCNDNFAIIYESGGGPAGATGESGATGATGKRGSKIWINTSSITSDSDYDEHLDDDEYQDCDLVFFSDTNIIGQVSVNSSTLVKSLTNKSLLKGDTGATGATGSNASNQFDVNNGYLVMKSGYEGIIIPQTTIPSPQNNFIINCDNNKGLSFSYGANEQASSKIYKDTNGNRKFINSTDGIDYEIGASLNNNLTLGKVDSVISKSSSLYGNNINIDATTSLSEEAYDISINGDNSVHIIGPIELEYDSNNKVTIGSNGTSIVGGCKIDTLNATTGTITTLNSTKITSSSILSNNISFGTDVSNSFSISYTSGNNKKLRIGGSNSYIDLYKTWTDFGGAFTVNSNGQVYSYGTNTNIPVKSEIQGVIGNVFANNSGIQDVSTVYLGIPKFTMNLVPENFSIPESSTSVETNRYMLWTKDILLVLKSTYSTITSSSAHMYRYVNISSSSTDRDNIKEISNIYFLGETGNNSYTAESISTSMTSTTNTEAATGVDGSTVTDTNTLLYDASKYVSKFVQYMLFNGFTTVPTLPSNVNVSIVLNISGNVTSITYENNRTDTIGGISLNATDKTAIIPVPESPTGFKWLVKIE